MESEHYELDKRVDWTNVVRLVLVYHEQKSRSQVHLGPNVSAHHLESSVHPHHVWLEEFGEYRHLNKGAGLWAADQALLSTLFQRHLHVNVMCVPAASSVELHVRLPRKTAGSVHDPAHQT